MSLSLFPLLLLFLFSVFSLPTPILSHGHLPRAYLPPSKNGSFYGNSNRPDVLAELQLLSSHLLVDESPPILRVLVNASLYGALPNDGQDDWKGLNATLHHACTLSQSSLTSYQNRRAEDPSLPSLPPLDPDRRPVFVEVRFDPGTYDLAGGLPSVSHCQYLLLNGQNSTILTHFEPNFSPHQQQSAFYSCDDCTYTYVYDFVFTTALPGTTIGEVTDLIRGAGGKLTAFRMTAIPYHAAWEAVGSTIQHVGADGGWLMWDEPVAVYGGYEGNNITTCAGTTDGDIGGCMEVSLSPATSDALTPYLTIGQYMGAVRGYCLPMLSTPRANTVVMQNLRSIGHGPVYDGPFYGAGGGFIDIIDVHNDRIWPDSMLQWSGAPVGQTGFSGRWRIWHYSHESDSDDLMDDMASAADVMAVDFSTNSATLQIAHGRWAACNTGYGGHVDDIVEVGRFGDPFNPYATLTVRSINSFSNRSACGNNVTFVEKLPPTMRATNIVCGTTSPSLLHLKNLRIGNHAYNQWNVKAHSIVMEDSFLYNTTMAGFDVSTDTGYWYEVPRANNLIIRNNVFERMNGAIALTPYIWAGPGATDVKAAPSGQFNVSIIGNIVWANETTLLNDWFQQYTFDLHAIHNLTVTGNEFYLTPGMRRDLPVIRLCNVRNATIEGNSVFTAPLDVDHPGMDCEGVGSGLSPANGCEPYPSSHVLMWMTDSENAGCLPEYSGDVVIRNNSWERAAAQALNRLMVGFDGEHFSNSSERLNQGNAQYMPAVLDVYEDRVGVREVGVGDWRGNGVGRRMSVDLLSHWNGMVYPTDGIVLGAEDFSVELRMVVLGGKGGEAVLSLGRKEYERLDVEVNASNATHFTVEVQWTHNDSAHDTTLYSPPLYLNQWVTVNLTVTGGAYRNSSDNDAMFTLWVEGQMVDQKVRQVPPKLVIPTGARLGCSLDMDRWFMGLVQTLQVEPAWSRVEGEVVRRVQPVSAVYER